MKKKNNCRPSFFLVETEKKPPAGKSAAHPSLALENADGTVLSLQFSLITLSLSLSGDFQFGASLWNSVPS